MAHKRRNLVATPTAHRRKRRRSPSKPPPLRRRVRPLDLFSTEHCVWCLRAKALLRARRLAFIERRIEDPKHWRDMLHRLGLAPGASVTLPQIFQGKRVFAQGYDGLLMRLRGER